MAKMVAKNPESPQAHSLRAQYLTANSPTRKRRPLRKPKRPLPWPPRISISCCWPRTFRTAAGDYEKAREYANRAISARPKRAGGYRAVSKVESRQGEWKRRWPASAWSREGVRPRRTTLDPRSLSSRTFAGPGPPLSQQKRQNALKKAQETVARLRRLPQEQTFDPVLIDYLQAEIEAAQGHWFVAAKAFAEVARQLEHPDQNLGSTESEGHGQWPAQGRGMPPGNLLRTTWRYGRPVDGLSQGGPHRSALGSGPVGDGRHAGFHGTDH